MSEQLLEKLSVPKELRSCFSVHHQVRHGTMMLGLVLRKLKAYSHSHGNSELGQLVERMEEALEKIEEGLNNCVRL